MTTTAALPAEAFAGLAEVIGALEEDIIFGRLKPRERLIEEALVRRFAVKRHVIRDALSELERQGIVVKAPHRGCVVRDFAIRDVEQIYEMRELLQERAARCIALPAEAALVERLAEIHRAHLLAVDADDLRRVFHLNNEFHDTLFAACGNPYLAETVAEYAYLAHAIRSYRIADPVLLRQAADEHAAIIAALAAGDREALVRLCVDHIKPAKEAYLRAYRLHLGS
ncbi:MAG: GntR family transcriptional regulator [Betaproteobacteria bacterium]